MDTVEMGLKRRRKRRIVEVYVEQQLLLAFGETFAEFPLDGTVTGTDLMLHKIADDITDIFDLSEFTSAPIMQKLGPLENIMTMHTSSAFITGVVEGVRIEPETVDGTAETISF